MMHVGTPQGVLLYVKNKHEWDFNLGYILIFVYSITFSFNYILQHTVLCAFVPGHHMLYILGG